MPFELLAFSLRVDGWLYLVRPALALLTVAFAVVLWAMARHEARLERVAALHLPLPPPPVWWVECGGQRHPVRDALTIGRSADCAIVLTDPAASALHAAVTLTPEGIRLDDMDSRNGTLCRGQLVRSPVVLAPGDEIQIGDAVLRIGTGP